MPPADYPRHSFYRQRAIRKKMRKTKWYKNQINELAYFVIINILYGNKASIRKKERYQEKMKKAII
jgi:hypothetical protein